MKNTVVVSAIIKNEKGEALLIHYDKEKEGGVLIPPGGKMELGESARETVIRECKEELGVQIEVKDLMGISELDYGDGKPWIFLFYSAEIINGTPQPMEANRVDGKVFDIVYTEIENMNHFKNIRWI